jgi:hypothetical protein
MTAFYGATGREARRNYATAAARMFCEVEPEAAGVSTFAAADRSVLSK